MASPRGLAPLIQELKRRRVFRVAFAYLVVAWAVVEVAETTFPYLGIPAWVVTAVIVIAILAFPLALALGWAFDLTPTGIERTPASDVEAGLGGLPSQTHRVSRWAWVALVSVVFFAGLGAALAWAEWGASASLDPALVAVFPFRVSGTDPEFRYLGEGILDLLTAKLDGQTGTRAADPRLVMGRLQRTDAQETEEPTPGEARRIAADLGAARLLSGEVVATGSTLVLNASLIDVNTGRVQLRASVDGAPDRVPALVDQLAGTLMSLEAGEDPHRVESLLSTSLPALRAYLDGQAAMRRGRYSEARTHFESALEFDSLFAVAALRLDRTASWIGGLTEVRSRAIRLAWAERDRLTPRDRTLLLAVAGPRYPSPSPALEQFAAWEAAVEAAPDQAERWLEYADIQFHFGRALGIQDAGERAEVAFRRALELDARPVEGLHHLLILAARQGDTAAVRGYAARYLDLVETGDGAEYIRWSRAVALGDSVEHAEIRRAFPRLSTLALTWIAISIQEEGIALDDAEAALAVLSERAATNAERRQVHTLANQLHHNRGRPQEGLEAARSLVQASGSDREPLWQIIQNALFWEGDPEAAEQAVGEASRWSDAPLASDPVERGTQYADICFVELWRLHRGETVSAAAAIRKLASASPERDPALPAAEAALCAVILEALLAREAGPAAARRAVDRLDALMRTFPPGRHNWYGNLITARLLEELGEGERALEAVRRRPFRGRLTPSFLSTYLREEARLAELQGDGEGAEEARRHLAALRAGTGSASPPSDFP